MALSAPLVWCLGVIILLLMTHFLTIQDSFLFHSASANKVQNLEVIPKNLKNSLVDDAARA